MEDIHERCILWTWVEAYFYYKVSCMDSKHNQMILEHEVEDVWNKGTTKEI